MTKRHTAPLFSFMLLLIALLHRGCGKEVDSGGYFVPDLSQTWINQADASGTNRFFFLLATTGSNEATFTGNEFVAGSSVAIPFSGSYANRHIRFSYNGGSTKSGKSFSGLINDSSDRMNLSGDQQEILVLDKR